MKKTFLLFALFLSVSVLLTACSNSQEDQEVTIQIEDVTVQIKEPEVTEGIVKEFTMTVRQWEFEPSEIIVNKGDTVKLHITSEDVKHGFGLPEFGVNVDLEPGETVDVEFVAGETGTFPFACTVVCGSGHIGMEGQVIVE